MMLRRTTLCWPLLAASLSLTACGEETSTPSGATEQPEPEAPPRPLREVIGTHFAVLPPAPEVPAAKHALGRALYSDRRLSGDETISCATCHMLSHGGAEPRVTSTGIRGQQGPINSPTVLNAGFQFRQFWDGRAADLLEQAAGPVTNPIEMGGDWAVIIPRLQADAALVSQFTEVYGEGGLTQANVLDAITAYESTLVTPAPFDAWLGGDDSALSEEAQRGLRTFVEVGCTTCHSGPVLGGTSYQRMGLVNNYFERRGGPITEADRGRFNVTQAEEDMHKFKVPMLRNVALTTPYFHDGSERELAGAVRTMGWAQLGRDLTDAQVSDIVAFLESLTGTIPPEAFLPGEGAPAAAAAPTGAAPTGAAPAAPTPAAPTGAAPAAAAPAAD